MLYTLFTSQYNVILPLSTSRRSTYTQCYDCTDSFSWAWLCYNLPVCYNLPEGPSTSRLITSKSLLFLSQFLQNLRSTAASIMHKKTISQVN